MKRQDFYFDLPEELIAQFPLPNRCDSRLLVYQKNTDDFQHESFQALTNYLEPGDLLVFNDSKVIPARLYGKKTTGGQVELLVERIVSEDSFWAHIKASKSPKAGHLIVLNQDWQIEIIDRDDDLFYCRVNGTVEQMLQTLGHMPLPPYITRQDEALDTERYQTIYARHNGSVAAPTAGLHFDEALFQALNEKGVEIAYSTLHVGAGTFRPVRCDNIFEHKMHKEYFIIEDALCEAVAVARGRGKRVIAVGTTALRSLESATVNGKLLPCRRDTDIFIYPGYSFQMCDGLITNFHLPESTLLMLVAAFIGYEKTMELYRLAIEKQYRFFSYGDATLLLKKPAF